MQELITDFIGLWNAHETLRALSFILLSVFLAEIIHLALKFYSSVFARKTKTDIDDFLLNVITKPAYYIFIFAGVWLAVRTLTLPENWKVWIDGIFYIGSIFISAMIISKILSFFIQKWMNVRKKYAKTPMLIIKFVSVIVYIFAFAIVLSHFDVEITPLIATLGVGGLAVGLALQGTLSNLFAGLHIISSQPIKVGDYISIDKDVSGHVEDITWRATTIRQLSNNIIIIPNSKLSDSIITNYAMPVNEMSVVVSCGVGYGSDLEKVEKVTIEAAKKIQKTVEGAVRTHEPLIRYKEFGDSNINFSVILRVNTFVDKYLITHEFIKALHKAYNKNKIEISWPVVKVYNTKKKIE